MTTPAHSPTLVDLAARVRAGKTAPYSDLAAAVAQTEERLRALAGSIEILAASKQIKRDERQRPDLCTWRTDRRFRQIMGHSARI